MDDEEIDVELIKFIKKCQIKKAEASDRHDNGFGQTKKLMFNQLNFIKYIEFNTKADAISANGSKVLNKEWITKKLVLN